MIILGLTGSIGMGKTTTAQMFRDRGILVYDADATVHALYSGAAAPKIETAFPGTTSKAGVDRAKLAEIVVGDEARMKQLEKIVHPLVRIEEEAFITAAEDANAKLIVLDIPLLFETAGDQRVDGIIVVTAPTAVQKQRVMARDNLSLDKFEKILSRQYPDIKKRQNADFVIDTSLGMQHAQNEVAKIIDKIYSGSWVEKKN